MKLTAKVTSEEEGFVTIALPDGRVLDVFPSGNVQVYTNDRAHALEITMPSSAQIVEFDEVFEDDGRIKVIRLA